MSATTETQTDWMNTKELAAKFGVHRDTIYTWIEEGTMPVSYIKAGPGPRPKYLFSRRSYEQLVASTTERTE